jgi:YD repeat-containing protein
VAAAYNAALQTTSFTPTGQGAVSQTYAGLGQAERTGSGTASYANGILGVQSETTAGVTTAYQRDPAGTLLAERTPTGGDYYYVLDGHGSVIGLVNPAGFPRAAYGYDPYGGHTTATNLNGALPANPWRYSS